MRARNSPATHAELGELGTLGYRRYPEHRRHRGTVLLWGHAAPNRATRRREWYLARRKENEDKELGR